MKVHLKTRRAVLLATAAAAAFVAAGKPALAQDYPERAIKIIVPQAPGGLVDVLPRILAQKITETTKQPVVVENRVGGNGARAGGDVARAAPDGYTLLMSFHALNAMLPHMTKLAFDPSKIRFPSCTS